MSVGFPNVRLRRNRSSEWVRNLVAENNISPKDLIYPVFVQEMEENPVEVASMKGVFRHSIKSLIEELKHVRDLGIPAVDVFPYIEQHQKTPNGEEAVRRDNLVARTISEIKDKVPGLGVMADVALDPYTSHGHDGVVVNGDVANDETVEMLVQQSLLFAKAGADMVAPSDMMDGRVLAIRKALDAENFKNVGIVAYSAKYASNFYGPFRDAVGSKSNLGKADKRTYQMDYRNIKEAIREVDQDIKEGADMVIVKPGLPYLDVIRELANNFEVPILAYQVSGEYSMIKVAAEKGMIDEKLAFFETVTCFKRAGASGVLTYYAKELAEMLNEA